MAPGMIRISSLSIADGARAEYRAARLFRNSDEPRISPYVNFFAMGSRAASRLVSARLAKSSSDMLAAHVSATLYLAVVSWVSIHFNHIRQLKFGVESEYCRGKTHSFYFERCNSSHSRNGVVVLVMTA